MFVLGRPLKPSLFKVGKARGLPKSGAPEMCRHETRQITNTLHYYVCNLLMFVISKSVSLSSLSSLV